MKKTSDNGFNIDLSSIKTTNPPCIIGNYMTYISYIIIIIISFIVIYAMNQIEKSTCECVMKNNKNYIKEWFIFMIIYQTTILLTFILSGEKCWTIFMNNKVFPYVYGLMIIISIIHIIFVFKSFIYLNELRTSCKCAYNLSQKILFWYFLISICFFISIIFLIILMLLYVFIFYITYYFSK